MLKPTSEPLLHGKKSYTNTGFLNNDDSSCLQVGLYGGQHFFQNSGKALGAVIVQADRDYAGVGVSTDGQQSGVVKVLSDDCLPLRPRQFKDVRIFRVRWKEVTDPTDFKSSVLEERNCAGRDILVSQVAQGLR